ncbi:cyclic pyranopterin monophosphate synthase MoaC [Ignatzschineria ureiclastica]|uniref:Cyclic pyranopterin monophosphate synthase n=1 Tax=Ignatzschineria ureiclastica TaxID=472582 RepID=A0A2U2AEX0_9GAMM|nr:cyclic pyranopterin monophosphate synthase MoaC [Ignatzschineria ureiclastica]PWD81177.1 cyclic pyranopterin monophosphate synthase MoaC [Ignatzschineria ureiclastica]GGZ96878.1 cyclic pyranopterin monophosphate synthase accessory protein [Ignatzschineria ureiclastica]
MGKSQLTHLNAAGEAHMVDVSDKAVTKRVALATGSITMNEEAFTALVEEKVSKGNVLGIARIAAIQGAKKTSDLIPLCHPLPLTKVNVEFALIEAERKVIAEVEVSTNGVTGVEMEALTATSVALLTVYDMLKAIDKRMEISSIALLRKQGGKSGDFVR